MEVQIFSVCAISISAVFFSLFLRRLQKEYALLITFAAAVVILLGALTILTPLLAPLQTFLAETDLQTEATMILLKCAGISILCRFISAFCADAGENALRFAVEFFSRCAVLLCCLPMLVQVLAFIRQLIRV